MGSSKKHKEKDRDRDEKKRRHKDKERDRDKDREEKKHKRKRDRSRSRERDRKKDEDRSRKRRRKSESEEDIPVRIKQEKTEDTSTSKDAAGGAAAGMSLSIEETNKLRVKLGLKPLEVDGEKKDESAEVPYDKREDVHKPAVNLAQERKREEIRQKMEMIKEKRRINQKLNKVKSLAEDDDEDELECAIAWVQKSRKIEKEKELAAKRAKLLEEMDEEFGIGELVDDEFGSADKRRQQAYTAKDLRGLRVEHSKESFKEGRDIVLTLKDKDVLAEDGDDILTNMNIIDYEKAAKNVELKKKKAAYNPYAEPEFDEYGMVKQKEVLSKYDEEIEGEKKNSFMLGRSGGASLNPEMELERIRQKLRQDGFDTLEVAAPTLATEYYTHEELTAFKKPKKKKRKLRKLKADDLIPDEIDFSARLQGASTGGPDSIPLLTMLPEPEIEVDNTILEDEAQLELQMALEKSRRVKLKKDNAKGAEKVAEVVSGTSIKEEPSTLTTTAAAIGGSIVLNSTSEFCRQLGDIPTYGAAGNREENEEEVLDFDKEDEEKQTMDDDEPEDSLQGWSRVNLENEQTANLIEDDAPILEDEPQIALGIAGALKMAEKKGYLDKNDEKHRSSASSHDSSGKNYTIEDKNYRDDDKHSRHDRIYRGPVVDFKEKDSYKPDVKVHYYDETGRQLNAKEAFRVLSHRFHGKGSGKMKTEKRNKKVQDELMMKQMSSTDTPLNTVARLQEKQKLLQTPFLVLSGGGKTLEESTMIKK
ncbi:U4/U6.U5 tri-snRNP-associated protein 1-like [Saccoglossus kowalevskii]|uniref:U4/U6.U5 tri-snRNP-associated protein 1-like n=1 Tax=Saccoglossus kowalevskii TaxID=10224 RepID=A0ABM0GV34_SACKO|nr:PREDICTED: U4/U6.U5 tri-snRNP-associated protein 1-like [Saccoglossus kowalevskii]